MRRRRREAGVIASFGSASLELQRMARPAGLVQWKSTISSLHFAVPLSLKRISHKIPESQLKSSQVQALSFAEIIIRLPNNMTAESTHSNAIHHGPSTAYMNCWNCLSCFEPQPFFFLPQADSP